MWAHWTDPSEGGREREGGERESALFPHPCTSPSPNPIPHSLVPSAVGPMCHPLPHSFIVAHFIQLLFPIHKPKLLHSAFKEATFNQFYAHYMLVVQVALFSQASRSMGEFPSSDVVKLPPSMIFVGGNSSTLKINFLLCVDVFCIKDVYIDSPTFN